MAKKEKTADDESPFEIDTLDSRYTGVVYNRGFGKKPIMSIQEVKMSNDLIHYFCYTSDSFFDICEDSVISVEGHTLGFVPIIEYPANSARIGAFELVMSLLDQINKNNCAFR